MSQGDRQPGHAGLPHVSGNDVGQRGQRALHAAAVIAPINSGLADGEPADGLLAGADAEVLVHEARPGTAAAAPPRLRPLSRVRRATAGDLVSSVVRMLHSVAPCPPSAHRPESHVCSRTYVYCTRNSALRLLLRQGHENHQQRRRQVRTGGSYPGSPCRGITFPGELPTVTVEGDVPTGRSRSHARGTTQSAAAASSTVTPHDEALALIEHALPEGPRMALAL